MVDKLSIMDQYVYHKFSSDNYMKTNSERYIKEIINKKIIKLNKEYVNTKKFIECK